MKCASEAPYQARSPLSAMALCPCLLDEEAKAQLRLNRAIERDLVQWKKDNSKEFKLLLLGALM